MNDLHDETWHEGEIKSNLDRIKSLHKKWMEEDRMIVFNDDVLKAAVIENPVQEINLDRSLIPIQPAITMNQYDESGVYERVEDRMVSKPSFYHIAQKNGTEHYNTNNFNPEIDRFEKLLERMETTAKILRKLEIESAISNEQSIDPNAVNWMHRNAPRIMKEPQGITESLRASLEQHYQSVFNRTAENTKKLHILQQRIDMLNGGPITNRSNPRQGL